MGAPSLRRSFLFVPGSDERKLAKAATAGADAVVLDLEDAVAASRKADARRLIVAALRDAPRGRVEWLVRVNGVETADFEADLRAVAESRPDGLVIPKVESPETVSRMAERVKGLEGLEGLVLFPFIEGARGLLRAAEIAAVDAPIAALFLGGVDLALDLGLTPGPARSGVLQHARCQFVLAARAAGRDAVDTVYLDVKDGEGLGAEARQAAELGFTGKLAIHPGQLLPIHEAFTPSPERVRHAERILAAWSAAEVEGRGVFALDGRLIEKPVVEAERRVVERARRVEAG
jgi:citrate lyase subunit beta / citryl-CoA lyase